MSDSTLSAESARASASTTRPSSPIRAVPGCTLPCTMPVACTAARASAIEWAIPVARSGSSGPLAVTTSRSASPVDPLADHVRPLALVDGVVDADQVGVDDPARVDRGLEHLRGGVAAGVPQHHRDGAAQDHVDAAPDLTAGAVVVDVFLELVPLGQDLTDGGSTEGHDRSGLSAAVSWPSPTWVTRPPSVVSARVARSDQSPARGATPTHGIPNLARPHPAAVLRSSLRLHPSGIR